MSSSFLFINWHTFGLQASGCRSNHLIRWNKTWNFCFISNWLTGPMTSSSLLNHRSLHYCPAPDPFIPLSSKTLPVPSPHNFVRPDFMPASTISSLFSALIVMLSLGGPSLEMSPLINIISSVILYLSSSRPMRTSMEQPVNTNLICLGPDGVQHTLGSPPGGVVIYCCRDSYASLTSLD